MLVFVGIDPATAVNRSLDDPQPADGSVENTDHIPAEWLRERQQQCAGEEDLKPAVDRHKRCLKLLGPEETVDEIHEDYSRAPEADPAIEAHAATPRLSARVRVGRRPPHTPA